MPQHIKRTIKVEIEIDAKDTNAIVSAGAYLTALESVVKEGGELPEPPAGTTVEIK